MLRLSRCTLLTLLFMGGCAKGVGPGLAGEGGDTQTSGGSQGGRSASSGGSVGSSGGTTAASCTPGDTSNLVSGKTFVCDATTPIQIQGSFYSYGDGTSANGNGVSCTSPTPVCSASAGCCMTGTTFLDTTYAKWGCGIGMELNHTTVKSAYSGPVKCFDITLTGSSGGNEVRIGFTQSTATAGKVPPFVSVAPFTDGWSGRVCFTDAECPSWAVTAGTCSKAVGTAGTPYDLQIQVCGGAQAGVFNVCVTKIAPVLDPGSIGTTNSCSSVTGQGTLSGQYDSAHVTCNGQDYIVQNNEWGSTAGQTISYGPGTKFKVTVQNGTGAGSAPASYPSIFIGANGGRSTGGSGLPKAVSALGTVQTAWTWADSGVSGAYNAAYDVWFSTSSGGDPSASAPSGGYLMVWLYKPSGKSPIGSMMTSTTIGGNNWNVWYGLNSSNGKPCVSYAAETKLNSLSFDLNTFIQDAVSRGYVSNLWSLTNVFSGFEIWSGSVGLETTDFAVTVN